MAAQAFLGQSKRVSSKEFQQAVKHGDNAMRLLKEGNIPPFPQFYELFYTYVTGVNPALNARIKALMEDSDVPEGALAEKLYKEFTRAKDFEDRLDSVSDEISEKISSVNKAIEGAISSTTSYSGSLEAASGVLAGDMDKDTLKALAMRLLTETRQMEQNNRALEERLESSRFDIAHLKRDLDEVRRESMLDPLTKIFNRKCFDQGLDEAISNAERTNEPLSLLLLDIDHFKQFNDNFGHQTGDQVLRLVAMTLKSNVKGRDMAVRYGGEEFAAILPQTDLKGAAGLAETLRQAIQAKELLKRSTNEKLGRITASVGISTYRPGDNAVSLIERADLCLYAAKGLGRNRVVHERDHAALKSMKAKSSAA